METNLKLIFETFLINLPDSLLAITRICLQRASTDSIFYSLKISFAVSLEASSNTTALLLAATLPS